MKTCRLAFNSETRVCKQTPFRTQELDKGVTSATRVGEKIVFVDGSGVVYTQDLFSEDSTSKSKLSLNLSSSDKFGIEKAEYVVAKVALGQVVVKPGDAHLSTARCHSGWSACKGMISSMTQSKKKWSKFLPSDALQT